MNRIPSPPSQDESADWDDGTPLLPDIEKAISLLDGQGARTP